MLWLGIVVISFLAMEGIAYASHRWIMHGFGWVWHESHHQKRQAPLEWNDAYGLVFSFIAIGLILIGVLIRGPWFGCWAVGAGMTLYGAAYLFLHDILVHRRFGIHLHPKNAYLRAVLRSHRIHHARRTKEAGASFGFLIPYRK